MADDQNLAAQHWLDIEGIHCEGVAWDPRAGRLRFVDIPRGRVFDVDVDGTDVRWIDLPAPVTAVHPTVDPETVLILDGDGIALARDGRVAERLAAPLAGRPEVRMNDGNLDPAGRYFAGSMAYDGEPGMGCLYRLDPDGSLHTVLTGVAISNGLDWSPDTTLCYFVDSPLRRIDVFDYDLATGQLSNRRPFADTGTIPGVPDGLTVDAEGGVWVAFFGGSRVCRFGPGGVVDRVVTLPVSQVTSCSFGGAELDQLFITTSTEYLSVTELRAQPEAGAVFRVEPGSIGRPPTEVVI
jgi:sugar lactone lactonase YvrE